MLTILWIAGRIMGGWYGRFQYIEIIIKKLGILKLYLLGKV